MIEIERFEPFDDSLGYFELPKGKYPVAKTFGMLVDDVRSLANGPVIFSSEVGDIGVAIATIKPGG